MEKGFKYTVEAIKKFGLRKILRTLSELSWFILPFILWIQIYLYLGQSYFVVEWAVVGLIVMLIYLVIFLLFSVHLTRLDKKLMRHVEYAKNIFNAPSDPKSEESFRKECNKFIIPYLHYPRMIMSGVVGILRGFGLRGRIAMRFLQIVLHFYVSYSIMVLFVINRSFFNQTWTHFSPHIPYLSEINVALLPFFQNPIPSTALIFLLSLYSVTSPVRRGYVPYSGIIWDIFYDSFSVFNKILLLLTLFLVLPFSIERRSRTLKYEPFTFPSNLHLMFQQSVRSIENEECNVTRWSYVVNNEKDIEALKYIIYMQKDIPKIIKIICGRADSRIALRMINESKPILYLGTIANRCAIIGRIEYDSYEKMFRGKFIFDNLHIKNQFKSIAEIEITEQKKLKGQLPSNLIDLMSRLKLEKEK